MNKTFKIKDLELTDIQYPNLSIDDFSIGEKVFLKSSPEIELTIIDIDKTINKIYTNVGDFIPQVLYKYNGNVIFYNHFLNLN